MNLPNPPILEYDMLTEMKVYMNEMIEEHKIEINGLVKIRQQFKKIGKIAESEETNKRVNKLKGLENKAHNFILFLKDYLEKIK
ncbi:hypothetical protein LCGC14_2620670 [marine sediment metagenome]|uniref:Uncharacterized protein n=1 Tax=marine sediment metagenome TaxID=412755 RepID=A0A0F9A3E2_9ZZZZ